MNEADNELTWGSEETPAAADSGTPAQLDTGRLKIDGGRLIIN